MKIRRLEVKNFRGFEHRVFEFSDQFNILLGDNGTGKTAVLEALAVGASALFYGFHDVEPRSIYDDDVRRVKYGRGQTMHVEPQYPVLVDCSGIVDEREVGWKIGEPIPSRSGPTPLILDIAEEIQLKVSKGEKVVLPLIAYYPTGRLWQFGKASEGERSETFKPGSRMRGYDHCLNPASGEKAILLWFKTEELAALQEGKSGQLLEAVKEAVKECMEDWRDVTYNVRQDELLATAEDGRTLPFRMLSDGIRNMLAMVMDIARRAAILNPHLGREAAKKTPGVVLIDEIDLHLHPKWQRRVVNDLRRTFPEIQFFATTHSPFIVQSLKPGEVIDLNQLSGEPEGEYVDKPIEDIAENVMGVEIPQRSERYQRMMEAAKEYYRVLQQAKKAKPEEIAKLKARLDELAAPFSDNIAYHAFLKMEREAAGLGGDGHKTRRARSRAKR